MKTCLKCGTQNNDGLIFCGNCGVNLTYQNYKIPAGSFSESMASNPAVKLLRQAGTSPMFLCAAALYSAAIVITVLFVFMPSQISSLIDYYLNDFLTGLWGEDFYDIYNAYGADPYAGLESIGIFSGLSGAAGPILMCIAMWLQYFAFKNTSGGRIKTTGLSIIRVITTINFVLMCVGAGLMVLAVLIFIPLLGTMTNGSMLGFLYVIVAASIAMIAAVIVFEVIYYIKLISTIKSIINTAETGNPETKISMFVIVFLFLNGGLSFLLSMAYIGNLFMLSSLLNAAVYVIIAVMLLSYKNKVRELAVKLRNEREYNDYYGIMPLSTSTASSESESHSHDYPNTPNTLNTPGESSESNESTESTEPHITTEQQQAPFVPPEE